MQNFDDFKNFIRTFVRYHGGCDTLFAQPYREIDFESDVTEYGASYLTAQKYKDEGFSACIQAANPDKCKISTKDNGRGNTCHECSKEIAKDDLNAVNASNHGFKISSSKLLQQR